MNSKETLFAGLAGLRGSVSLILAQAVVTEDEGGDSESQVRFYQFDAGLFHEDVLVAPATIYPLNVRFP